MSSMRTADDDRAEACKVSGMQTQAEPYTDSGITTPAGKTRRRRMGLRLILPLLCILLLMVTTVSFIRFADKVASMSMPNNIRADAIVVLTGGTERVSHAVRLLEENRAERLLISGVHPGTTVAQISTMTGSDTALFDCCVDLDRLALNTEGNAIETASWAHKHAFSSLLLVTSAYHLPRAEVELQGVLPDVRLIPYPVQPAGMDLKSWYRQPATIRLLLREYVKYTLASFRILGQNALRSLRS
ncbi:YdcF family protein [uncultured Roseibium sp.]|uniref:YdcF family protein n=1 Tax=uncultured Roseibium sp. TaxID=1936171 RepID=UPI0032177A20